MTDDEDCPQPQAEGKGFDARDYVYSAEAQRFYRYLRRDQANIFNAIFFDKEKITEEEISRRVERASAFFDVAIPKMIGGQSECLAQIAFRSTTDSDSQIRYDLKRLEKIGINNCDAFDAVLTHELSHQFVAAKHFEGPIDPTWASELACDYLTGVRCYAWHIASGKYKYAVREMPATASHPAGRLRERAVESGFAFAQWLEKNGCRMTAENSWIGFLEFTGLNAEEINQLYNQTK